jgi:hypothetical protein
MIKTKFTKGQWHAVDYAGSYCIQDGPYYTDKDLLSYASICGDDVSTERETVKANVKLILAAPRLFYEIVLIANHEGWAYLFDIIKEVTGIDYDYGSDAFQKLVKEAKEYISKKATE